MIGSLGRDNDYMIINARDGKMSHKFARFAVSRRRTLSPIGDNDDIVETIKIRVMSDELALRWCFDFKFVPNAGRNEKVHRKWEAQKGQGVLGAGMVGHFPLGIEIEARQMFNMEAADAYILFAIENCSFFDECARRFDTIPKGQSTWNQRSNENVSSHENAEDNALAILAT